MDFCNYEYCVEQKPVGKWKAAKILLLLSYIAYSVGYFLIIYITRIFTLGALIPFTLWILVFFTWRYIKPEYKYAIAGSEISFAVIYSKKSKREKFKLKIADAVAILPLDEANAAINEFSPKKIYRALPSKSESDAYAMLFKDAMGNRCAFYFVATSDALRYLHLYNKNTVVRKTAI